MLSTKPKQLPSMKSMVNKALLTFRKGAHVSPEGIHVTKQFEHVLIDKTKLQSFSAFFGFNSVLPLPFLYLLAQRTQAALMLDKQYTLSIPGTIHLNNRLQTVEEVDPDQPFHIEGLGEVAFKEAGSLLPKFQVRFYQKGSLVALCDSEYLVKRKRKSASTSAKRTTPELLSHTDHRELWTLEKGLGKKYASVSDDHNPIHKSKTAARLAGFKSPIIQGWYLVSRAAQALQGRRDGILTQVQVNFIKPVFLPGTCEFLIDSKNESNGHTAFQLLDSDQNTVLANGRFGYQCPSSDPNKWALH